MYRLILIMSALLIGCATAPRMNHLSLGMTKDQVLDIMGSPSSTSAKEGAEYLTYMLSSTGTDEFYGNQAPYFVRIKDGKVDAYGRAGDFGTTRNPESTVNVNVQEK